MTTLNPSHLLNTVAGLNCVDAYLLAEDAGFVQLVRKIIADNCSYPIAIEWLSSYVQNNY